MIHGDRDKMMQFGTKGDDDGFDCWHGSVNIQTLAADWSECWLDVPNFQQNPCEQTARFRMYFYFEPHADVKVNWLGCYRYRLPIFHDDIQFTDVLAVHNSVSKEEGSLWVETVSAEETRLLVHGIQGDIEFDCGGRSCHVRRKKTDELLTVLGCPLGEYQF